MLYGIVCAMAEKNEAAETFFEAATNVDPKNVLAWTLMGKLHANTPTKILMDTHLHAICTQSFDD